MSGSRFATDAATPSSPLVERLERRIDELEQRCGLLENEAEALHAEIEVSAREVARLETELDAARRGSGTAADASFVVDREERGREDVVERGPSARSWWRRFADRFRGARS